MLLLREFFFKLMQSVLDLLVAKFNTLNLSCLFMSPRWRSYNIKETTQTYSTYKCSKWL